MKEIDIVQYLIKNWPKLFFKEKMMYQDYPVEFYCKEYKATDNWRCDLLTFIRIDDQLHPGRKYRMPIYTEVKFNNNGRDLLLELSKGLQYVQTRGTEYYPRHLCVIADDTLDQVTIDFIKNNGILFYQYSIKDDDITTFEIHKIN